MTSEVFREGMDILQGVFGKRYSDSGYSFFWEELKNETNQNFLSACKICARESTRLPALSDILRALPASSEPSTPIGGSQAYWDLLNGRHAEYEKVVGASFDSFVSACSGNKAIACLYFGKAYWNARGIKKYDNKYDEIIGLLEKGEETFLPQDADAPERY